MDEGEEEEETVDRRGGRTLAGGGADGAETRSRANPGSADGS
jgi:hypothetical protein